MGALSKCVHALVGGCYNLKICAHSLSEMGVCMLIIFPRTAEIHVGQKPNTPTLVIQSKELYEFTIAGNYQYTTSSHIEKSHTLPLACEHAKISCAEHISHAIGR